MKNFNEAYLRANLLYGLTLDPIEFEEIGLIAWEKISTKKSVLYTFRTKINSDLSIDLPCNLLSIEAITYDFEDWKRVSNLHYLGDVSTHYAENYSEMRLAHKDEFYKSGKLAKYSIHGDTVVFDKNYGMVTVLYKGVLVDEDGLPFLSEKQVEAIACYCAYTMKQKEAWITNNQNMMQFAQALEQKWVKLCDAARIDVNISQNDMNRILDTKCTWNRKIFGKSYKPIK